MIMKNKSIRQEKNEKQVNIESKKLTKKRWIWLTLCIGFVSIAVIVTIIVSLNFKSNPTPTLTPNYEGVHYNNSPESIDGDPAPLPPMVKYSIDVEKDNYAYDQEFIIKYTIGGLRNLGGYDYYIEPCNDLNVKIVSDKFEFISPTEYHFDLETDISTYENILSFGNEEKDSIFPIEIELKVKATKQSDTIDHILFLLDVPLRDYYKERLKEFYAEEEGYKDQSDEFTKDFEWVHKFYFLNDEIGTLLVDMNKRIDYYDTLYK
ncbi:MAG: hypothetical protein K2J85_07450, partial [Anaeroplasmataceae bacterium]|nr:hypothetical protein [Anaeroplasmataceae bacterium]